jgi:hypothetical protein
MLAHLIGMARAWRTGQAMAPGRPTRRTMQWSCCGRESTASPTCSRATTTGNLPEHGAGRCCPSMFNFMRYQHAVHSPPSVKVVTSIVQHILSCIPCCLVHLQSDSSGIRATNPSGQLGRAAPTAAAAAAPGVGFRRQDAAAVGCSDSAHAQDQPQAPLRGHVPRGHQVSQQPGPNAMCYLLPAVGTAVPLHCSTPALPHTASHDCRCTSVHACR